MDKIKSIIIYLPDIVNLVGLIILTFGFVRSGVQFFKMELYRFKGKGNRFRMMEMIRGEIGLYILLSIDIMIIADLINSMISESIESLMYLGAIVVIRTIISYFLEKEVDDVYEKQKKAIVADSETSITPTETNASDGN